MAGDLDDEDARRMVGGICVSCGQEIEAGPNGFPNHHCRPAHEGARKAANVRHTEPAVRRQTMAERLAEGFRMMGGR